MSSGKNTNARSFSTYVIPGQVLPFGFDMTRAALAQRGHAMTKDDGLCDVLTSIYWGESLFEWLKKCPENVRKRTIAGGVYCTGSPAAVAPHCTGVYCGDGEVWDGISDLSVARVGHVARIAENSVVPVHTAVMDLKSIKTGQSARIIELTRGCRGSCAFCQYKWIKPFRQGDAGRIQRAIRSFGDRIRLVSVEFNDHGESDKILECLASTGTHNLSQDTSFAAIRRGLRDPNWRPPRMMRFGLDGQSERLRRGIMKPIGTDEFCAAMVECSRRGTRRALVYNLFGLPTESVEDCKEFLDATRKIARDCAPPFTMSVCWNAFIPCPQTPLQWAPSSFGADVRDVQALIAESRPRDGVNILHMPAKTGDELISLRVLALRATLDCADLVLGVANGKIKKRDIPDEYRSIAGKDLHGAIDGTPPWDGLVMYDRTRLWEMACRVHRNLGMKTPEAPARMDSCPALGSWAGSQDGMAWQPTLFDSAFI